MNPGLVSHYFSHPVTQVIAYSVEIRQHDSGNPCILELTIIYTRIHVLMFSISSNNQHHEDLAKFPRIPSDSLSQYIDKTKGMLSHAKCVSLFHLYKRYFKAINEVFFVLIGLLICNELIESAVECLYDLHIMIPLIPNA